MTGYLYDAEGRICAAWFTASGTTVITGYLYDAGGTRVGKGSLSSVPSSCPTPTTAGFTLTSQYLLGRGGEQVTELNGSGAPQHTNLFAGGKLATYDFTGAMGLHFALTDPLGTKRVQVSGSGTTEEYCRSFPFGNSLGDPRVPDCPGAPDATEHHFTGKERDAESGNDYFEARYYSSAMGRFMSPDWSAQEEPVPYAKLDDPQTLNLYAYVGNNPLSRVDSDGHQDVGVVIQNGKSFEGHQCGDGECVSFVKQAGGFTTPTKDWKAGPNVLDFADKGLQSGTAIMLADKDGHYPTGGARHAAEFIQFNKNKDGKVIGIKVREQWAARFDKKTGKKTREGQPVKETDLPIKNGKGTPQGDASQYHILMIPKPKEPKK